MSDNYRFSQQCCGNACGTKPVKQNSKKPYRRRGTTFSAFSTYAYLVGLLALLLTGLFVPNRASAQSCGTGLTSQSYAASGDDAGYLYGPLKVGMYNGYYQMVYPQSGLCKGKIKSIAFKFTGYNSGSYYNMSAKNNVKIYLVETDKTSFTSATDWIPFSQLTEVYSGNLNCSSATTNGTWNYFTLNGDGFNYSGEQNLAVVVLDNSNSRDTYYSYHKFYYDYSGGTDKMLYVTGNSTYSTPVSPGSGTRQYRPSMALCIECNNCNDRTGSITFTETPLNLIVNHSSDDDNIASNTVSPSGTVHFSSSNTSVATVDANTGIVTAVAAGSATITATIDDDGTNCEYSNSYTVNVTCIAPIFQWTATSFTAGQSTTSFPQLISNHPQTPTYTSSATGVATINSSGTVNIVGAGTTTIRATVPASGDTCSASAQYTLTIEGPCTPVFDDTRENYFIRNFTVSGGTADLNSTSLGTANSYTDYYSMRSVTVNENVATTLNFSITAVGGDTYGAAIWIDYNGDGFFSDAECVWRTASAQASPITGSFTVPASATRNEYRMRVLLDGQTASPSDPCNVHQGVKLKSCNLVVIAQGIVRGVKQLPQRLEVVRLKRVHSLQYAVIFGYAVAHAAVNHLVLNVSALFCKNLRRNAAQVRHVKPCLLQLCKPLLALGALGAEAAVTVNLAPADRKKEGSSYDLAIFMSILKSAGLLADIETENMCFVGELSLSGAPAR